MDSVSVEPSIVLVATVCVIEVIEGNNEERV